MNEANIDNIDKLVWKMANGYLKSIGKDGQFENLRIIEETFHIEMNNPSEAEWVDSTCQTEVKTSKEVCMKNDTPTEAKGNVTSISSDKPKCSITLTKGVINGRQYLSAGCKCKAGLTLPESIKELFQYQGAAVPPLGVDLSKSRQEAIHAGQDEVSVNVPVEPGTTKCSNVTVEEMIYKGTFKVRAYMKIKLRIQLKSGSVMDMTQGDLKESNFYLPTPFIYDPDLNRISWPIEGSLDARFDYKRVLQVKG